MQDRDDALLVDMFNAARRLGSFTQGLTRAQFLQSEMLQSAVLYQLQIVGEAASRVSPTFQGQHPEILWREIIGLRNRLVHGYLTVDRERIWAIVDDEVGPLIMALSALVPPDSDAPLTS